MTIQSARPASEPSYLTDKGFGKNPSVFHGFFGRKGGISKGFYESLNCGPGSDDVPENILLNRKKVSDSIGVNSDHLLSLYQVHGDACLRVEKPWPIDKRPQADAMVTDIPGLALGVLTADCAPVLFYGEAGGKPVIGAAHAGWGGAFKGILEATVQRMEEAGAAKETIRAVIGPCIGRRSYEVAQEFYDRFAEQNEESERFFTAGTRPEHFLFDLAGYCALRLFNAGIFYIAVMDRDTYKEEEMFFSYRRAAHRGESSYGRQISVIMIQSIAVV